MTSGSWEYYDHEVSVDDYYAGHGEEAGQWVGSGAALIGLSGTVEDGQLARLFDEGRHPVNGAPLGLPYRHDSKRRVVTGFALSFSPPKSVSLLDAFGSESVAVEVNAAHDAAVHAALNFLEEHTAFSRTGRGGFVQVDTEGFVLRTPGDRLPQRCSCHKRATTGWHQEGLAVSGRQPKSALTCPNTRNVFQRLEPDPP